MTPRSRFRMNVARWTADGFHLVYDISSKAMKAVAYAAGIVIVGFLTFVATHEDHGPYATFVAGALLAIITFVAFVLLIVGVWSNFPSRLEWDEEKLSPLQRLIAHVRFRPIPAEQRRRVAVHEAGHALLWAACEANENVSARISRWHYEGYVHGEMGWHLSETAHLYVRALGMLAGHAAELSIFGNAVAGFDSDMAQWQHLTRRYLLQRTRHSGAVFYADPASALERESNDAQLSDMRECHLRELAELFTLNRPLLEELATQLDRHGRMADGELRPFLYRFQWRPVLIPVLSGREGLKLGQWFVG